MIGTRTVLDTPRPAIIGKSAMDSRDIAADLLRRHGQLEVERAGWDSYWQEIADCVTPRSSVFGGRRAAGARRTEQIFDSTAP